MLTRHPWDKILIGLFFVWLTGWYVIDTHLSDEFWKPVWSASAIFVALVLGLVIDRREMAAAWRRWQGSRKR